MSTQIIGASDESARTSNRAATAVCSDNSSRELIYFIICVNLIRSLPFSRRLENIERGEAGALCCVRRTFNAPIAQWRYISRACTMQGHECFDAGV